MREYKEIKVAVAETGHVGLSPSLTLWGNFHKFLVIFSS